MTARDDLPQWASEVLGLEITQTDIVVETTWSKVLRLSTKKGLFYLKQCPTDLLIEQDIYPFIHKHIREAPVPQVLHSNLDQHCFIMTNCGDTSLRQLFQGHLQPQLWWQGLESYIQIQRGLESDLHALEQLGLPNWHFDRLPSLTHDLLNDERLIKEEGLEVETVDDLKALLPDIQALCKQLAQSPIQATLVNCDFNENNLILDKPSQKISVIDLGESVISHPFFSIAAHLNNTARRYRLDLNDELLLNFKKKYLSCWSDVATIDELESIYQGVLKLLPLFFALGIDRLQLATHQQSKSMQTWFVKDALLMLLDSHKS